MSIRSIRYALGVAVPLLIVAACAPPEPTSRFGLRKPDTATDKDPSSPNGGLGDSTTTNGGDDDVGETPDDFKECATKTAAAEAKPVYLVFMFDKSGSMVTNSSPKWASAKAASKAFFEAPDSMGVHASLSFFPDQETYSCNTTAYSTPRVAMKSLPNADFGTSLDAQKPIGGTPTFVALQGAIDYAQEIKANEGKDGTVAIVLVTDGLPDSVCTGNSIPAVKDLAATVAATLPTYVIGVGNQLTALKDIAVGGGTNNAFIVNTENAAQIQQDFLTAVNAIKASALACDYEIPAPPSGEQLDHKMVNVVYRAKGGSSTTIPFNQSCENDAGWRYDDENNPKRILLCGSSCDIVKAKPGQMEVLFGCASKGPDPIK